MKLHHGILAVTSAFMMLLPTTLLANQHHKNQNKSLSAYSLVTRMAQTLGGLDKILAYDGIEFTASGNQFEPEQSVRPGGSFIPVVNYNYKLSNRFTAQQSRTEWTNDITYAFLAQRQFTEIINGDIGAVIGFDTIISPGQAPMLSSRLGARVKQNLLSSPLALIHYANQHSGQLRFLGTQEFKHRRHFVVDLPGFAQQVRLFIDSKTRLLSKVETVEDDTVYGDTLVEIIFTNWVALDGIKLASNLTYKINGRKIKTEHRSAFNLISNFDTQLFTLPTDLIAPANADQFAWGQRMSQWFTRLVALGIPFDLDQRSPATLTIDEIAPKVFHARALTHHSMIIEMQDHLIVTEAPLYEERSITVINAIKKRWPNKPIKYLIVTHFHNDHIGGIRAYGAIGATIIIGDQTKSHYEALFKAKHSVAPDSYALNPRAVEFKVVEVKHNLILSDGTRNVRIMDIKNRHSIGLIVPFVEDAKILFVSDLYNPALFSGTIPQDFLGWAEDLLKAVQGNALGIEFFVGGHGSVNSYDEFVSQVESSL